MLAHFTKAARAESARINGAQSTTRGSMLPGESVEEFTELQTQLRAETRNVTSGWSQKSLITNGRHDPIHANE